MTHLPAWQKSKTLIPISAGKDVKQQTLSFTADGNAKLNIVLPYNPAIALPDIYPTELKILYPHSNLYTRVYSSLICNFKKLEASN